MVEPLADGPVTEALHCRIDQTVARPTVTPLYQASAFSAMTTIEAATESHA